MHTSGICWVICVRLSRMEYDRKHIKSKPYGRYRNGRYKDVYFDHDEQCIHECPSQEVTYAKCNSGVFTMPSCGDITLETSFDVDLITIF